jgi:hypothetical protein
MITSIEDIQSKLSGLRRGRGSKRITIPLKLKEQIVSFLSGHQEISITSFCQQTGISQSAVRRWLKDLTDVEAAQMVPVSITDEVSKPMSQRPKSSESPGRIVATWISISFPSDCPLSVIESISQSLSRSPSC